jgi:lysozyme
MSSISTPPPDIPIAALALIRAAEGCRREAYQDVAGVWTIGYGHTGTEVKPGLTWSEAQCETALRADVKRAAAAVDHLVTVPLNVNQKAALIDFVFNLGSGRLAESTLLRRLNVRDYVGAASQFGKWVRAGDHVLPALIKRREAERRLFIGATE